MCFGHLWGLILAGIVGGFIGLIGFWLEEATK